MELYKSKYSDRKKSGRNSRDNRVSHSFRNSRNDNSRNSKDYKTRESTTVTCADCGTECRVPFVPRTNRPVYCSDCFKQNRQQDYLGNNDSRHSRDNRHSRSTKDNSRSSNDKFLRKQSSLFSGGSEKFYASLKEKLFEILGGKICSNCGFNNEKALGFSHKYDESFDNIRRGGAASSWGKYISEPKLAREELYVLCLNCNEVRLPLSKPKEDKSKFKQKKSRRFPR